MGKLILLSNFGNGYPELIEKVIVKNNIVFSYIPSRTELGEIYFERVKNTYQKLGIREFHYIDIDKEYKKEDELFLLNSDIVFLAGGDDPFIIKNLIKRNYDSLIRNFYENGGTIIGLCAGASILSKYCIVSDYAGVKFTNIQVIPWGIGVNNYMYYSRFNDLCNIKSLIEFSVKYNMSILAAYLESAILIDNDELNSCGKVLLIEKEKVTIL